MIEDAVKLTKRESEIAELFAWGATKKDIANRLYISEERLKIMPGTSLRKQDAPR